jgi:hypothetical protein
MGFSDELTVAVVPSITQDLRERIFKSLRAKVSEATGTEINWNEEIRLITLLGSNLHGLDRRNSGVLDQAVKTSIPLKRKVTPADVVTLLNVRNVILKGYLTPGGERKSADLDTTIPIPEGTPDVKKTAYYEYKKLTSKDSEFYEFITESNLTDEEKGKIVVSEDALRKARSAKFKAT